jgi:hypothetical protein
MKRLFYSAGIFLTLSIFGSCAQHDTKSPDTSGALPNTQPGAGVDTTQAGQTTGGNTGTNMNNDGTNNNQQTNTGDTTQQR